MIAPDTLLQNRYLVRERIGQGGMGAVYIATDQRFGSTVALKETFFDDPSLRRAFEREARLLNHLRHHALPRVSDHFSEEQQGQFLVMEYIPGDDLSDMLHKRGGAFPLQDVLAWADQLLDALDYLHTQEPSVVHRDIKPQNLKLTARNQIVLLDFGLAKGTPLQTRVTGTGSVFGYSRNYAPLEQMQGTGTDPRSDLYSLAATLYHLTTGVTPPDALTRATAVLNGQPDPLRPADEVHAQIPRAVAEVLSRSMSQNAAARPQTAEEMRAALREAGREAASARAATSAATLAAAPAPATNIQDQETQLLGATRAGARPTDAGAPGDTAQSANALGASTVINAPMLPPDGATAAAAVAGVTAAAAVGSAATNATPAAPDSIVTRVAPAHADTTHTPRRGFSVRTLGALASVLLLVAVAGAYLAFTRNPAASQLPPPPAPLPAVSEQPAPPASEAAPDTNPQPTLKAPVETTQPVAPVSAPPTQARPQQQQQQPPAPAQKSAKGDARKPASEEDEDARESAEDSDASEPPDVSAPMTPDPNVDWTNPAQRQRALRRIRRAAREQQRGVEQQRRQMEERRRRRPPMYPPPPR